MDPMRVIGHERTEQKIHRQAMFLMLICRTETIFLL